MSSEQKGGLRRTATRVGSAPPVPDAASRAELITETTDEQDPLIGGLVANRYRVLRKLGEGGMGVVYLAEHTAIEKKIALKVLLHEYARKQDLKDRFLQEAKAAARIGHENIVDITDFGATPNGSVFFAMEYLEGEDLSHLIKRDGAIPWSRAKPIVLQICRALGAAHSKEIIHRDMKPENIYLIEREGRGDFVKLLDFGIAKMNSIADGERRLTRTGMIFGTPEYMSPEQAQGHHPDHRVDIYAVGVIMYEMLTGEVPFKADTFMGILTKHIFEQPTPPSQLKPDLSVPAEVEEIILKAMAKNRDDRFRSMAEMAAAVTSASGRMMRPTGDIAGMAPRLVTAVGTPSVAGMTSAPAHRPLAEVPSESFNPGRGKLIGIIVVAVVVVLGVVAAVVFWPKGDAGNAGKAGAGTGTVAVTPGTAGGAGGTTPGTASTPPAGPHAIKVTIDSRPQAAEVYAGERKLGVTPDRFAIQLPDRDGKVLLVLKKAGHADLSVVVDRSHDGLTLTKSLVADKPGADPQQDHGKGKKKAGKRLPLTKKDPATKKDPVLKTDPTPKKEPKKEPKKKDERLDDLIDPFKR